MSGDIINAIDAAVDGARDDTCACGCARPLTADSPSLYYASQACQRRGMRAAAGDDRHVFPAVLPVNAPYAAARSDRQPGHDLVPRQLREAVHLEQQRLAEEREQRQAAYDDAFGLPEGWREIGYTDTEAWRDPSGDGAWCIAPAGTPMPTTRGRYDDIMAFTRFCPQCRRDTPARHGPSVQPVEDLRLFDSERIAQYCSDCAFRYARTVRPGWHLRRGVFHLSACLGHRRTSYALTRRELNACADPRALVSAIWRQLVQALTEAHGPQRVHPDQREIERWMTRMSEIIDQVPGVADD